MYFFEVLPPSILWVKVKLLSMGNLTNVGLSVTCSRLAPGNRIAIKLMRVIVRNYDISIK